MNDRLFNILTEAQDQLTDIEIKRVEALASCFDKADKNLAESIRENGIPKEVYCNPGSQQIVRELLPDYILVKTSAHCSKNRLIFSWRDSSPHFYKSVGTTID